MKIVVKGGYSGKGWAVVKVHSGKGWLKGKQGKVCFDQE